MKRLAIFLGCVALVTFTVGCDETTFSNLSPEMQAMVSSYLGTKTTMSARPVVPGDQTWDRIRDRDRDQLHDGTCDGDGSQNQNGGGNNAGNGNGTGGSGGTGSGTGDQDQLRKRDGSCLP